MIERMSQRGFFGGVSGLLTREKLARIWLGLTPDLSMVRGSGIVC